MSEFSLIQRRLFLGACVVRRRTAATANEFSNHHSLSDAALEAARLRFRPIVMTSMAFILGVVPLVIASGAGAASRHSIGTGVFGGMLADTFLAIFFVPLFFVVIRKLIGGGSRSSPDDASAQKQPPLDQGEF